MSDLSGKKAAVVGLGLSGVAAARLLRKHGAQVTLTDDKPEKELQEAMRALEGVGASYRLGGIDRNLLLESDLIVISPGVPSDLPQVEAARRASVEVISEVELAYWYCSGPIVAITGTNGKTTTTMLAHHIARHAGINVALGGNVEIPFAEVVNGKAYDLYVLEVSSFQLENIEKFRPRVGVLLNITPDHFDRHRNMENYVAAKLRLFSNQGQDDFAVLNRDDQTLGRMSDTIRSPILWFSMKEAVRQGAFVKRSKIVTRFMDAEHELMDVASIPLFGRHNVENVLAALAAMLPIGVSPEICRSAVESFRAVEHRLERVREVGGVLYVNDSKATNIDALEKSLESFDRPIVLIAGGRGKKSDYRVLRRLVEQKVREMILIGEDAPLMEEAFGDVVPTQRADTLPDAVKTAAAVARPGDCVLLAPACASFDMFQNYKHRGHVFKEAVQQL
ncbi:MAG: UDP-N-acetylmuramoyl-L-alanine--D-glutamate ligase [Candidatus Abyssubacteria bacterium]